MQTPQDCKSMAELRLAIDALDQNLVALLVQRADYIDRAIELKTANGWPARIPARVEEVVQNARHNIAARGGDPELAEALWRVLVDWSIAREELQLEQADCA